MSGAAAWPPAEARRSAGERAGDFVLWVVTELRRQQLFSGEIAAFERLADDGRFYWPTPLFSTLAHDALGVLDHRSPWLQPAVYDLIPVSRRRWLAESVAAIRWRLRGAVAFNEEADGTWRLSGRGSGLGADAGTSACAAAVLLESQGLDGVRWQRRGRRHVRALARLRRAADAGFGDPRADAEVLRFLALMDDEVDWLTVRVLEAAAESVPDAGPGTSPVRLIFAHAAARAFRQGGLARRPDLAATLAPDILALELDEGGFGSPQRNALAAAALLDLGHSGPALERIGPAILDGISQPPAVEAYLPPAIGSPAWVMALSAAAVARLAPLLGWSRE